MSAATIGVKETDTNPEGAIVTCRHRAGTLMSLGHRHLTLVLVGVLLVLHACARPGNDDGGVRVSLQALSLSEIQSVDVMVSGAGISRPLPIPIFRQPNGEWAGIIRSIPVGTDRTFTARAYASAAREHQLYSGSVGDVAVPASGTVDVVIVMEEDRANPGFTNHAPTIDRLIVSATRVDPGSRIALQLAAHDDDPGDTALTLSSTASCGTVTAANAGADGPQRIWSGGWTAPIASGACRLTFEVRDPHGAQAVAIVDIDVGQGSGGAWVSTWVQSYPVISNITSSPISPDTSLRAGGRTALTIVASHPDGERLSYRWSTDCAGNFDNAELASPVFTLAVGASAPTCTFTALVSGPAQLGSDGVEKRLSVVGALTVNVGQGPVVTEVGGPVIDLVAHSSDVAAPGDEVTFSISARETNPTARLASITWTTSAGTLAPATMAPDLRSSQVVWTAPSNMATSETITAVVTDSQGATASHTFFIDRGDPPLITNMTSTPVFPAVALVPGGSTLLSAIVEDVAAAPLSFAWISDCAGTFDDAHAASPLFTLTSAAQVSSCTFVVVVTEPMRTARDGHTYQLATSGALTVSVGVADPEPVGGPAIDLVAQSDNQAGPGGSVVLFVTGTESNPQAHLTGYAWHASAGSLGTVWSSSDLSASQVTWTAPANMGPWETIEVTLTDSQGATATYSFWIFSDN